MRAIDYYELERYCIDRGLTCVPVGVIKSMADIEAEPVRYGHWIDITPVMSSGKVFKCSKCGRTVVLGMSRSNLDVVEEYPYCHCGAKMRKEDE